MPCLTTGVPGPLGLGRVRNSIPGQDVQFHPRVVSPGAPDAYLPAYLITCPRGPPTASPYLERGDCPHVCQPRTHGPLTHTFPCPCLASLPGPRPAAPCIRHYSQFRARGLPACVPTTPDTHLPLPTGMPCLASLQGAQTRSPPHAFCTPARLAAQAVVPLCPGERVYPPHTSFPRTRGGLVSPAFGPWVDTAKSALLPKTIFSSSLTRSRRETPPYI